MRKQTRIVLIIIIVIIGVFMSMRYRAQMSAPASTGNIDSLISSDSGNTTSGNDNEITIATGSADGRDYEGGGEYTNFSAIGVQTAIQQHKRAIIIFERTNDQTSDTLHDDIVSNNARIPKNTIIFFADVDAEQGTVQKLSIENANSIIYLGSDGQEIRRKGNGIVSLSQVVDGIDGLR